MLIRVAVLGILGIGMHHVSGEEWHDYRLHGPYCGIRSVYVCLASLGITPDKALLVDEEFIGSRKGSTPTELVLCAKRFGAFAKVMRNLHTSDLYGARSPMVLHFRSTRATTRFNHWVAFMGVDGTGKFRIIDGSAGPDLQLYDAADVLAMWDGVAIVIDSRDPAPASFLMGRVTIVATLVATFLILWTANRWLESFRSYTRFQDAFALLSLSSAAAFGFHHWSDTGFFANQDAVAEVTRRYAKVKEEYLTLDEFASVLNQPEIVLIDARLHVDFEAGTISTAINVPVNSSLPERIAKLRSVDRTSPLIVFCQTKHCNYAHELAAFLKANQFSNVRILDGGYVEWSMANKK